MIIKALGLFAIIISCFLIGVSIYEQYYRRTAFLQNYINFVIYIKNEINYTKNPIHKIFKNYHGQTGLKDNTLKLSENLKSNSLEHSWFEIFKNLTKEHGVSPSEQTIITEIGKNLGIGDSEIQINILKHHIETLKACLSDAAKVQKSKGKLPIVLGLGIGLFIAIIFL